jgi:hypothetical protein
MRRDVMPQRVLRRRRLHAFLAGRLLAPRLDLQRLRRGSRRLVLVDGSMPVRVRRGVRDGSALPERRLRVRRHLVPDGLLLERLV